MKVTSMHIDASLYVVIAVCGFIATMLGTDETFQMFGDSTLWYMKLVNGSLLAGATALKMFRSTAFADHKTEVAEEKEEHKAS